VSRNLRPAPPPLEANDQLATAVITGAWAIALVTVLVLRDHLPPGDGWWVWVCVLGLCMGLFGLWYVPRLKRARARNAARRAQARADASGGVSDQTPIV
jgi:type VI protein secretion system component VasK